MAKSSLVATVLALTVIVWGCGEPNPRFGVAASMPAPAPAPAAPAAPAAPRGPSTAWVAAEPQLKHLGLETWWSGKLTVNPPANIIDAYVLGDSLILEAADKHLYAVDRMTGVPKWTVDLPNRCDFRGAEDDANLYVPCRNVLVAVDKRGFVKWRNFLEFAPGGIPMAADNYVFMPCFDGRMRAFRSDSGYFAWQYSTAGAVEARPAVGARHVYAGSTDGTLYALTGEKLDLAWSFKTYGPIRGGVVFDKLRVFVASNDGALYCLNALAQASREQQLAWNRAYASGASIDKTPFVAADMVCVINRNRECHAVDRDAGRKLWIVPDVDEVLAQGKLNTYLLRKPSKIVAADNKTGAVRWQLDVPADAYAFFLINTVDDAIYMVKTSGETQAIRELRPPTAPPAPIKVEPPPPGAPGAAPAAPAEGEGDAAE